MCKRYQTIANASGDQNLSSASWTNLYSPAAKQIFHIKVSKCFHTTFFAILLSCWVYSLIICLMTLSHIWAVRDIVCLFCPMISPSTGRWDSCGDPSQKMLNSLHFITIIKTVTKYLINLTT